MIYGIPEWPSGFPYFLQYKSEFGNKEFCMRQVMGNKCNCLNLEKNMDNFFPWSKITFFSLNSSPKKEINEN